MGLWDKRRGLNGIETFIFQGLLSATTLTSLGG